MLQNRNPWPKIAIGVVVCELAGLLSTIWTLPAVRDWYPSLQKPPWTPPAWVFGPVWTLLYALMGIAVGLVWAKGLNSSREKRAFAWFWGQLGLSVLWSAAFFGLRSPTLGYICVLLLWMAIAATLWLFSKISRVPALLLWPYLLWVTYASMVNFGILSLNVIKPGVQKMDADPLNGRPDRKAPTLRNLPK